MKLVKDTFITLEIKGNLYKCILQKYYIRICIGAFHHISDPAEFDKQKVTIFFIFILDSTFIDLFFIKLCFVKCLA